MDKKELCGRHQKYVKYKVANVIDEEINRKSLSGFPYTSKWRALGIYEPP